MSFDEFFRQGLRDAERRLPMLKPIGPDDQQKIAAIVRSSRVFQLIDRAVDAAARVCESSTVVGSVRRLSGRIVPRQRQLLVGLGLIVAAVVHVSLVMWQEQPPSWFWLIVPGLAVASGVLILTFTPRPGSGQAPRRRSGQGAEPQQHG